MTTYSAAEVSSDRLKNKIQQREARIGIIGLGYVGLPLALLYSEQKFRVTGFDIDARKVDTLAKGGSYIYRIAPEPHLRAGQLVVLESTTYPGTTEEVMIPILEKENRHALKAARGTTLGGDEFLVAFSPEREDPGNTSVARRDIP